MKPVTQTILGDTPWGNCLQSSIASILEIDLVELPNFITFDGPDGQGWWYMALCLFMRARGLALRTREAATHDAPRGYAVAIGPTRRGGKFGGHAVVVKDGKIVHDPHPSNAGLASVDHWLYWEPMPERYDDEELFLNLRDSLNYCRQSGVRQAHEGGVA